MFRCLKIEKSLVCNLQQVRFQSMRREQIFFNLINDYNRKRSIQAELLINAVENINSRLSERLAVLILSGAARCVHHVTSAKRVELLDKVWKTFMERKVRLTTRHYETYLTGLNDNGVLFDADFYLNLIRRKKIHSTPRLYSLILNQYCRLGDLQRVEHFLQCLREENLKFDENIFAALIVAQIKLGDRRRVEQLIEMMKERDLTPTIGTYKEILTVLINEHDFEQFEEYFRQIDRPEEQISTLYIDAPFIIFLMEQCLAADEEQIFQFLLNRLKNFDYQQMTRDVLNLAIQCATNDCHRFVIDLMQLNAEPSIHGKHWIILFRHLLDKNEPTLIEKNYFQPMLEKKLTPLDALLRVCFNQRAKKYSQAMDFLEHGLSCGHPMRTNYFYPLLINAFSPTTSSEWNDEDRLRLFRLLNRSGVMIESSTYARLIQQSFHQFYEKNFSTLLTTLANNKLEAILDRICRLLLNDIRRSALDWTKITQIVPHFRLHTRSRQEELARHLFSMITGVPLSTKDEFPDELEENSSSNPLLDLTPMFNLIDSICETMKNDVPTLKRDLFGHLIQISSQHNRLDFVEEFRKKNVQVTGEILPLNFVDENRRTTLEEIYLRGKNEQLAIKTISEKISGHLNEEIFQQLIKFLQNHAMNLSINALNSIGNLLVKYRISEPMRIFWKTFYKIFLQRTNSTELVQFYSNAVKQNSNVPYLPLFEIFVKNGELHRLQEIVDLATLQHGSLNVSHDLAFVLIENGKVKQAERIFQLPWFRVKNDRINLHSVLLAESNHLDALLDAIKLTENLVDVDLKPLFNAAIRVAIHLNKTETIVWLLKETEKKKISIDIRQKKFVNAHLMSKGLDPIGENSSLVNDQGFLSQQSTLSVHN